MNKAIDWAKHHPRLSMWLVLGIGMVAIIAFEARDVGLLVGQWIALIVATVLVAGLCVWIIGWEDDEEETPVEATPATSVTSAASSTAGTPNASVTTPKGAGNKKKNKKKK